MQLNSDDLPAPLGPSTARSSLGLAWKFTPSRAVMPPNRNARSRTSRTGDGSGDAAATAVPVHVGVAVLVLGRRGTQVIAGHVLLLAQVGARRGHRDPAVLEDV